MHKSVPFRIRCRVPGQQVDAATGLMFYNARWYDPALGRFISADTIVPEPGNPQALNRYAYVANNPLRYTDPSGYFRIPNPFDLLKPIARRVRKAVVTWSTSLYANLPPYRQGLREVEKHHAFIVNAAEARGIPSIYLAGAIADQGNAITRPFGWDAPEVIQWGAHHWGVLKKTPSVGIGQIRPSEATRLMFASGRHQIEADRWLFVPEVNIDLMGRKLALAQERILGYEAEGYVFSAQDSFMLMMLAQNTVLGYGVVDSFVDPGRYGGDWQNLLRTNRGAWRVLAGQMAYMEYLQSQGWALPPGIGSAEMSAIRTELDNALANNEW